jgi:hypothetical protein
MKFLEHEVIKKRSVPERGISFVAWTGLYFVACFPSLKSREFLSDIAWPSDKSETSSKEIYLLAQLGTFVLAGSLEFLCRSAHLRRGGGRGGGHEILTRAGVRPATSHTGVTKPSVFI